MNHATIVEQMCIASALKMDWHIEWMAYNALCELGLPVSSEKHEAAYTRYKERSPLYVKSIVLVGVTYKRMYDDHSPDIVFDVDDWRCFDTSDYCRLADAKRQAERLFTDAIDKEAGRELRHGSFYAHSIELHDQFDRTVDEAVWKYQDGVAAFAWVDLPDPAVVPAMLEAARGQYERAADEARWDNFDTARGLRHEGARLKRLVEMSGLRCRLIL